MDARAAAYTGFAAGVAVKIRDEQLEAIAAAWRRLRRAEYALKLRGELGSQVPVSNQELEKKIEDGWAAASLLGITGDREVYRFLRLMFVKTKWDRPGLQEVTFRVLTDTTLSANERLDFVERSLLDLPHPLQAEMGSKSQMKP
jgi:hypothetical protein